MIGLQEILQKTGIPLNEIAVLLHRPSEPILKRNLANLWKENRQVSGNQHSILERVSPDRQSADPASPVHSWIDRRATRDYWLNA